MAVEVEMSDDIRKYETKTIGPFTTRQAVCTGIALLYSIPIGVFAPVEIDNKILIILVVALPVILAGYIKMDGATFEILLLRLAYWKFLSPPKRKYKTPNTFHEAMKEMEKKEKRKKLARMSEEERKAFAEKEKQSKIIVYSKKKQYRIYK